MATTDDGIISVSFRPLVTMDQLHILLLAAVSAQTNDVTTLDEVFSLPSNVVTKELAILETYGLAKQSGDKWTATVRGQHLADVWNEFQKQSEIDVQTTGRHWLLGPGEFSVDEMIRDKDEIEALACDLRIADVASSLKFLEERRRVAEEFESFVRRWPSQSIVETDEAGFAEGMFFENIKLAESDEALTRLEELLATHVSEMVGRFENNVAAVHTNGEKKDDDTLDSIRKRSQDVIEKFAGLRKSQRRWNHHLAKVKMISESLLAGQWLSSNIASLADAYSAEPAAFIFRSTVPLLEPDVPEEQPAPSAPRRPSATQKPEDVGALRSLFRWLFG